MLDTFVIEKDVVVLEEVAPANTPLPTKESATGAQVSDHSYTSGSIQIDISQDRVNDTNIYVADVKIDDISRLKAGLADGKLGRNVKAPTSQIAEENNAILAINGDFYGYRDDGYVLRNGYLYRDVPRTSAVADDLAILKDGSFLLFDERFTTASQIANKGALQIFSFGPILIEDSKIIEEENTSRRHFMSSPRTAIGLLEPLHYLFVVSEGRSYESRGIKMWEMAEYLMEKGCKQAYNLDGGGSTTMWFNGQLVNNPTDGRMDGERKVSDIIYVGE